MQYVYNLKIGDGERLFLQDLLEKHINDCKNTNIPVGLFAQQLHEKITHSKHL